MKYANGELLFLGAWNVGVIHYDSCCSVDDQLKYKAQCMLPGIKTYLGHFKTMIEAKNKVEKVVKYWLSKLPNKGDNKNSPSFT